MKGFMQFFLIGCLGLVLSNSIENAVPEKKLASTSASTTTTTEKLKDKVTDTAESSNLAVRSIELSKIGQSAQEKFSGNNLETLGTSNSIPNSFSALVPGNTKGYTKNNGTYSFSGKSPDIYTSSDQEHLRHSDSEEDLPLKGFPTATARSSLKRSYPANASSTTNVLDSSGTGNYDNSVDTNANGYGYAEDGHGLHGHEQGYHKTGHHEIGHHGLGHEQGHQEHGHTVGHHEIGIHGHGHEQGHHESGHLGHGHEQGHHETGHHGHGHEQGHQEHVYTLGHHDHGAHVHVDTHGHEHEHGHHKSTPLKPSIVHRDPHDTYDHHDKIRTLDKDIVHDHHDHDHDKHKVDYGHQYQLYHYDGQKIPECALKNKYFYNLTFCLEDHLYPTDAILWAIKQAGVNAYQLLSDVTYQSADNLVDGLTRAEEEGYTYKHYFGGTHDQHTHLDQYKPPFNGYSYSPNYYKKGGYICPSDIYYGRPRRAMNTYGTWKVIVNLDYTHPHQTPHSHSGHVHTSTHTSTTTADGFNYHNHVNSVAGNGHGGYSHSEIHFQMLHKKSYTQTLRLEQCIYSNAPCSYIDAHYHSRCIQKHNFVRLVAWTYELGLHIDTFKMPIACSCHIRQPIHFHHTPAQDQSGYTHNTHQPSSNHEAEVYGHGQTAETVPVKVEVKNTKSSK